MSTTAAATDSATTVSATAASTVENLMSSSMSSTTTDWVFNYPFLTTGGSTSSGTVGSTFRGTVGSMLGSTVGAYGFNTVGSTFSGTMGSMLKSTVGAYGFNTSGSFFGTTSGPRMMPTAKKPPKFGGADFKRWQQKMSFYLTTLGFANFLKEDAPPVPSAQETSFTIRAAYDNWHGEYLCKNFILSSLEDSLYNVYSVVSTSKEMWASSKSFTL